MTLFALGQPLQVEMLISSIHYVPRSIFFKKFASMYTNTLMHTVLVSYLLLGFFTIHYFEIQCINTGCGSVTVTPLLQYYCNKGVTVTLPHPVVLAKIQKLLTY